MFLYMIISYLNIRKPKENFNHLCFVINQKSSDIDSAIICLVAILLFVSNDVKDAIASCAMRHIDVLAK